MRGRPPKPIDQHKLHGTYRKDRHGKKADLRHGGDPCPRMPSWLSDVGKTTWKRLAPWLRSLGLLDELSMPCFACYCQATAEFQWAVETLAKEGRTVARANGSLATHPAVTQERSATKAIKDFGELFGLTPASRSRLGIASPPPGGECPLERLKRMARGDDDFERPDFDASFTRPPMPDELADRPPHFAPGSRVATRDRSASARPPDGNDDETGSDPQPATPDGGDDDFERPE